MPATTNAPLRSSLDEVLGNTTAEGMEDTARVAFVDFSAQLLGSGPLAAALVAETAARTDGMAALQAGVDADIAAIAQTANEALAVAASGLRWTTARIEARATGNVDLATGLVNGATLNGVTVQTGKNYFLGEQTAPAENGIYSGVAAGTAGRAGFADSAAELGNIAFVVQGGTAGAGERWTLPLAAEDIVVGTTALVFAPTGIEPNFGDEMIAARQGFNSLNANLSDMKGDLHQVMKTNGSSLSVSDVDGNVSISMKGPVIVESDRIEMAGLRIAIFSTKWNFAVADGDGNVGIGYDRSGSFRAPNISGEAQAAYKAGGLYDFDLNGFFVYGQSLSVGQALPVQSGGVAYDHLMFGYGLRPQYDYPSESANWYNSLVPAVEVASPNPTWTTTLGETPCRGAADSIKERILAEDGKAYTDHTYRLLLSAPGYGALTIAQLSKGTAHFTRMVDQVEAGVERADDLGLTFAMQAVALGHGESDYLAGTTQAVYLSQSNTLVADIQTDFKDKTGQSKRIAVIAYQVATHHNGGSATPSIAMAQLECAETNPDYFIATPMYHLPYADGFHLTGRGSSILGAYFGLAYKRIIIDQEDWSPLRPIWSVRQGKIAEIRFHVPKGRLFFDFSTVAEQPNKGFELYDDGGAPMILEGVEIVDYDRIRFNASAPIPIGGDIRYAWQGNAARGLGNLRDTAGDTIRFDPGGINYPMHDFSVIFRRTL